MTLNALKENRIGRKGGSSIKEPVFSRRSGWEREARGFCAFSQSLSSLCRPSLLPGEVPGGLQAAFDPHQPGSLGPISQCNNLCFRVLRGNSTAPFPFHDLSSGNHSFEVTQTSVQIGFSVAPIKLKGRQINIKDKLPWWGTEKQAKRGESGGGAHLRWTLFRFKCWRLLARSTMAHSPPETCHATFIFSWPFKFTSWP